MIKYLDIRDDLERLRCEGLPSGNETGWTAIDHHYRPERGYMTILTGIPGHGKSEWWDCLMFNMAWMHGWRWAVFSPENFPIAVHFNKFIEKYVGLPLAEISEEEHREACDFIDDHFTWLYPSEDKVTLSDLLKMVDEIRETYGCDGFVFDPWNEIDHKRPAALSETEYISQSLSAVRRFAREKQLLACLVAHPTKINKNEKGDYPVPTPYDISGSAHWRNKADFCITVHRDDLKKNEPKVYVQKVKFKNLGKLGDVELWYDYKSGRMTEPYQPYRLPRGPGNKQ